MLKHIEVLRKDRHGNKTSSYKCTVCGEQVERQGMKDKTIDCGCSKLLANRPLPKNSSYTVLSKIGTQQDKVKVLCTCGVTQEILVMTLFKTEKSCKYCKSEKMTTYINGVALRKHTAYRNYDGIKQRCYNKRHKAYKNYGGIGITMCDEWKDSPEKFLLWADANGYIDGMTIDRKEVNKAYSPENCRWITFLDQRENKHIQRNNTSGYTGVSFNKSCKKFESYYTYNRQKVRCGYFNSALEASEAREAKLKHLNITYNRKGRNK